VSERKKFFSTTSFPPLINESSVGDCGFWRRANERACGCCWLSWCSAQCSSTCGREFLVGLTNGLACPSSGAAGFGDFAARGPLAQRLVEVALLTLDASVRPPPRGARRDCFRLLARWFIVMGASIDRGNDALALPRARWMGRINARVLPPSAGSSASRRAVGVINEASASLR